MTIQEYESIHTNIIPSNLKRSPEEFSAQLFRWELLKALWDIARALRSGLED
jgi:hypothetical protein